MKKLKLLCILFSVVISLSFGLAGCSSGDNSPMFDEKHPWSFENTARTETCTYEFTRYLKVNDINDAAKAAGAIEDKGYPLNSSGDLTYTIKEGASVEYKDGVITEIQSSATASFTLVKMTLTVVYKDSLAHLPNAAAALLHAGKTDTMISYAVINRYSLAPVFTYKKTDIGAQNADDNKNYTMVADYTGNFTGAKEATLTDKKGTVKTQIKDGNYFDSESIYYIIRAMRSVRTTDTTSRAFEIASPYDDLLVKAGKLSPKSAQQATSTELYKIPVEKSVYELFLEIPEVDTDGTGTDTDDTDDTDTDAPADDKLELPCFATTLSLAETKSGPAIYLYYSSVAVMTDFDNGIRYPAKKVLVMSSYNNHDQATNAIYLQEFSLSGYTIK